MYNFHLIGLSEVSKDQSLIHEIIPSFTDRVQVAAQTVALGMLIVFSVLAILWIILEIAGRAASKSENAPAKKIRLSADAQPVPKPTVIELAEPNEPESYESYENDEEIVAAITAAITLMLEAENTPVKGFRVVSFKRAANGAHWNR